MHNLFSLYEVVASAAALQRLRNARQFILTRCGSALSLALSERFNKYFLHASSHEASCCIMCSAFDASLCIGCMQTVAGQVHS